MITIFTIPKPFTDNHINIIQRNAIKSWINLRCKHEIFLVGNDEGVREAAQELNIRHIPYVKTNQYNTPLLNSAFDLVKQNSKNNIFVYFNSDIILLNDFAEALKNLPEKNFLGVGQRWDLNIDSLIDFNINDWNRKLKADIKNQGILHSSAGIDYFIFDRNSFNTIPPFAVGRVGWDNWMMHEATRKKMITIDFTNIITAIHQNHDYPKINKGRERKKNPEAIQNISHTKGNIYDYTIKETRWKATKNGIKKRRFYWLPFLKRYIKIKFKFW